jgi:hypothetical protein
MNEISISILEKYFNKCVHDDKIEFLTQSIYKDVIRSNEQQINLHKTINTTAQYKKNLFDWTSQKPHKYESKKVFISDSGDYIIGFIDSNCGTGHHSCAYIVENKEEGENLCSFLKSDVIKWIMYQFMRVDALPVPIHIIKSLPKDLLKNSFEKVFSFTNEELQFIKNDLTINYRNNKI